jgi:hypothetical protein
MPRITLYKPDGSPAVIYEKASKPNIEGTVLTFYWKHYPEDRWWVKTTTSLPFRIEEENVAAK